MPDASFEGCKPEGVFAYPPNNEFAGTYITHLQQFFAGNEFGFGWDDNCVHLSTFLQKLFYHAG
jgi:hypothetical protein